MPKDAGKNLGYHHRRAAGVYDAPDSKTKGNDSTTSKDVGGLGTPKPDEKQEEES
jgi:hypothetical protein